MPRPLAPAGCPGHRRRHWIADLGRGLPIPGRSRQRAVRVTGLPEPAYHGHALLLARVKNVVDLVRTRLVSRRARASRPNAGRIDESILS